jgi:hypothetical protein
MASLMFSKTTGEIGSRSDVKCPCGDAEEDIDVSRHRKLW